jgi:hypothetical protein
MWRDWEKHHGGTKCPLQPFYGYCNDNEQKSLEDKLISISRKAETFILIVQVNSNSAKLRIVALAANNGKWRRDCWNGSVVGNLKESENENVPIRSGILDVLRDSPVYAETSHKDTFDADSVYVFLRHKGKCNRFAVYDPTYHNDAHESGTVADCLESLLKSAGMAPQPRKK